MTTNGEKAFGLFQDKLGQSDGSGEWLLIDQERINACAELSADRQFIHLDPVLSAQLSPWGVPIAHGFLTLSMLTHLCATVPQSPEAFEGILMGVNYGFDKVRFVSPVKVDSKVRASSTLSTVEQKDANTLQIMRTVTIEIEGETKPAVVAEWITRLIYG